MKERPATAPPQPLLPPVLDFPLLQHPQPPHYHHWQQAAEPANGAPLAAVLQLPRAQQSQFVAQLQVLSRAFPGLWGRALQ